MVPRAPGPPKTTTYLISAGLLLFSGIYFSDALDLIPFGDLTARKAELCATRSKSAWEIYFIVDGRKRYCLPCTQKSLSGRSGEEFTVQLDERFNVFKVDAKDQTVISRQDVKAVAMKKAGMGLGVVGLSLLCFVLARTSKAKE